MKPTMLEGAEGKEAKGQSAQGRGTLATNTVGEID